METNIESCLKYFQPCSTFNKNSSKILTPSANCRCIYSSECKKFHCEESDNDSDEASIDIQVQSQEDLSSVGLLNISYSKLSLECTASQQSFKINDHSDKYSTLPVINSYNCHHSINFSCNLQHSQSPEYNGSFFNDKQSYCFNQFNNQTSWDYHMDFLPRKLAIEESRKRKCGCDLTENKKEKCGTRTDLLKDFLISSASFEHKEELSVDEGVSTFTHNGNINGTSLENGELKGNEGVSSSFNSYNHYNDNLKEMSLECKEEVKVNEGVSMSFNSYNQNNGNPEESNDLSATHNLNESIDYVDHVNWNGFLTEEHFQQPCGLVSYVNSTASNFSSLNIGFSEKRLQNILNNHSNSSSNNVLSSNDEHFINSSIRDDSSRTFDDESTDHDQSSREKEKYLQWLYETDFKVGFIDTHCHIDFLFKKINFNYTFQKFIEFSKKNDPFPKCFEGCVAVFCDPHTFYKISWWENILLSDNVWGAFGCHPHFSHKFGPDEEKILNFALKHKKVKAAGEIGLDYSGRNDNDNELQKSVFEKQLTIALQFKKPIVIHCRDAFEDAFEIMKKMLPKNYTIHLHCFTGSLYEARQWMECFPNLYFGFTCIVTQTSKRAMNVRRVVQAIPLNRILLETDTPYFRPIYLKEGSFSHPGMAIHVAATIAEIHQIPLEKVLEETRRNTHDVYSI